MNRTQGIILLTIAAALLVVSLVMPARVSVSIVGTDNPTPSLPVVFSPGDILERGSRRYLLVEPTTINRVWHAKSSLWYGPRDSWQPFETTDHRGNKYEIVPSLMIRDGWKHIPAENKP